MNPIIHTTPCFTKLIKEMESRLYDRKTAKRAKKRGLKSAESETKENASWRYFRYCAVESLVLKPSKSLFR